jgi:SHS2 domain-containing protein
VPWRLDDHTADLAVHVEADDLSELFEQAGQALMAVLVEAPEAVPAEMSWRVERPPAEPAVLLVDWLQALLLAFELDHVVSVRSRVRVDAGGLHAFVEGAPFDADRHRPGTEVKAITFHRLSVTPEAPGWVADFVLDV